MGSLSASSSQQQQQSQQTGSTFVDPNQQAFLQFLRTQGQGIAQGQLGAGGVGDFAQQQANQLGGIGQGFLQNLQGIAGGGGAGQQFLEQRLSQQNPFLNEQISQLGTDISDQFNQSILPGIRRNATAVGGLGGAREGVATGLAAQGAQDAFAQQAASLRFQDIGMRQQAAGQLQQGQNLQAQAALGGLGSLGGLANLGLSPFAAQFSPLAQFGNLLGGPTVLSQSQGTSSGSGSSSAFGIGIA